LRALWVRDTPQGAMEATHMGRKRKGKRFPYPGVIDVRWNADDTPSGYKGKKPIRVYCHYRAKQELRSFPADRIDMAIQWKRSQDDLDLNRGNPDYIKRHMYKELARYKVFDLIHRYIAETNLKVERRWTFLNFLGHDHFPTNEHLDQVKPAHFERYKTNRLEDTYNRKGEWKANRQISRSTVQLEIGLLWKAFDEAIRQDYWDVCSVMSQMQRTPSIVS
jgi:hypothetical protein